MRLLLDTHFLVWLAIKPEKVDPVELAAIDRNVGNVFVSAISLWELRIKWQSRYASGERKGAISPASALIFSDAAGFSLLPLAPELPAAELAHPVANSDPFDQLLLLQAQEIGGQLVTRDQRMRSHPLAWRG